MKKIISKTQLLIVVLVLVFAGCQKQENNVVQNIDKGTDPIKEYYIDIDSLSLATGIDIRKLSNHASITYFANKCNGIMNMIDNMIENPSKNTTIEEQLPTIIALNEAIQEAYNNSDYDLVLELYDMLVNIFANLDGFIIGTGPNGLQTVTFNLNTYNLPILQMEEQQSHILQIQEDLGANYPSYNLLSQEVKAQVIECATFLNISNNKDLSVNDCKKNAKSSLTINLSIATGLYIATAAVCCGTFLAVVACEAGAYAGYMSTVATLTSLYKSRLKLCDLQGYY